jgi:hypothetical protein
LKVLAGRVVENTVFKKVPVPIAAASAADLASAVRLPPVRWLAASGRPLHDPFDARSGRCGAFSCAADVNVGVGRVISRDYSMLNHVLNLIGCGVNPEAHC